MALEHQTPAGIRGGTEINSGARGDDDQDYYAIVGPYPRLASVYAKTLTYMRQYRAIRHPEAQIKAGRFAEFIEALDKDVTAIGVETARFADKAIVARIEATRSGRPDRTPGPHLRDYIRSNPIRAQAFDIGAVGIARIEALNEVTNPLDPRHRPYWRAQEWGSEHLVGRAIFGAFFGPGGPAAPSPDQAGVHAYFIAGGEEGRGVMRVRRPIRARYFLRDGTNEAERHHFQAHAANAERAVQRARSILAVDVPLPGIVARRGLILPFRRR